MIIAANATIDRDGTRVVRCQNCEYKAIGRSASRFHECPNALGVTCGTGCQLKRTLAWFGIRDDGQCGCSEYAATLDAWGPDECLRRIEEIVEHLREAAAKRGLPFLATAARIAVGRAIEAARAESRPAAE